MNTKPLFTGDPIIEIELKRYDELIRTEMKYNLLRNALEDHEGYSNIDELKKHFGIPAKERKETTNE